VRSDGEILRVAVVRLPRISNFTDLDPLGIEPNVEVRFVTSAADLRAADLVVVPGSRSTVADLEWLRERGLADALTRRAREGRPILGLCGGFQLLGTSIEDPDGVESTVSAVRGLGLLPVSTRFDATKTLRRSHGAWRGAELAGYEIRHGQVDVDVDVDVDGGEGEAFLDGCRVGSVWGTLWHGIFESDTFRRAFLAEVAAVADLRWFAPSPDISFESARERRIDRLADLVETYIDTSALLDLIASGAPTDLPFVAPGADVSVS
jgi:adenosylcobyric acid synthase